MQLVIIYLAGFWERDSTWLGLVGNNGMSGCALQVVILNAISYVWSQLVVDIVPG